MVSSVHGDILQLVEGIYTSNNIGNGCKLNATHLPHYIHALTRYGDL